MQKYEEEGWSDVWVDGMDDCIGKVGKIEEIYSSRIFVTISGMPEYNFPPSSLELVKDA